MAKDPKEITFYLQLAPLSRGIRKEIVYGTFNLHRVMREVMKKTHSTPQRIGGFSEPSIHVYYPKDTKEYGVNYANADENKIRVELHPSLLKDKEAHDVILEHEVNEGICNLKSFDFCHDLAVALGGEREAKVRKRLGTPAFTQKPVATIKCAA